MDKFNCEKKSENTCSTTPAASLEIFQKVFRVVLAFVYGIYTKVSSKSVKLMEKILEALNIDPMYARILTANVWCAVAVLLLTNKKFVSMLTAMGFLIIRLGVGIIFLDVLILVLRTVWRCHSAKAGTTKRKLPPLPLKRSNILFGAPHLHNCKFTTSAFACGGVR